MTTNQPPSASRNTRQRVETWDLLREHSREDGVLYLSNRAIRDMLIEGGSTVTLPAVTARLQSLERHGNLTIHYHVAQNGRTHRTLRLLARPALPNSPQLEVA